MTHIHAPVIRPNSEIAERARNIHPVQFTARLLLTVVTSVFVALGWVVGTAWFTVAFSVLWAGNRVKWLWQCVRYGYVKGARLKVVPKE